MVNFKQTSVSAFLLLHLPLKIVQRLDMPHAFTVNGTECQGAEKVEEEDFRYVKELHYIG